MLPSTIQEFVFKNTTVQLVVPNVDAVQQWYMQQTTEMPFPYWAKVWPASIALANFIAKNPILIQQKNVLEIAAGLGLPSLVVAEFANTICCSDYVQEPLYFVMQSIQVNQLKNISCEMLDWNQLPKNIVADVLLLSDINYEPASFESLLNMLQQFLQQSTTIILATPQRLMAKPFIEQLLPYCIQQENIVVQETGVSILVLSNKIEKL
jgi:predicted nicotinamide N-methyase